jgi:hypothetical protein
MQTMSVSLVPHYASRRAEASRSPDKTSANGGARDKRRIASGKVPLPTAAERGVVALCWQPLFPRRFHARGVRCPAEERTLSAWLPDLADIAAERYARDVAEMWV